MGREAVVKNSKSVKHVQNSESRNCSSAAMLASWTGAKNLQTHKFDPAPAVAGAAPPKNQGNHEARRTPGGAIMFK